MKLLKRITKTDLFLGLLFVVLSYSLMHKTFQLNSNGDLEIATKVWSDFAATIPLIRSFSLGNNIPPEYPIFAGPPIRYHFVFFLFVGLLERLGLTLPFALNAISTIVFASLLLLIYKIAQTIFQSRAVGIVSVVLFLFNGSFSFIEFLSSHRNTPSLITDIIMNKTFPSFGPYDGKIVSAFWNLNIYTNQRHLALAYSVFLVVSYFLYKAHSNPQLLNKQNMILLILTVGLFPFVHLAVFGVLGITLLFFFCISKGSRIKLFLIGLLSLAIAIPQIRYMGDSHLQTNYFHLGYLSDAQTIREFIRYWFYNLGLILPLSFAGLLLSNKKQRLFFLPFFLLFIIGNAFQFSPEISANHKFFNLFVIGANMFVAYFVVTIWKKKILSKIVISIVFPLLIFSGVIDIFPIYNDTYVTVPDGLNNQMATYIKAFTPKDSTILNASFLYDSASLAGRKIFLGWPYFSWSAGYDTDTRYEVFKSIMSANTVDTACHLIRQNSIDYVLIQSPTNLEGVEINYNLYSTYFKRLYFDETNSVTLYDVEASCNKALDIQT